MKLLNSKLIVCNDWLNVVALLLVVATIPFSPSIQRIPLILFGASSLFTIFLRQLWKEVKWNKYSVFFLLLMLLYCVIPISHLLEPSSISDLYLGALHLYHNVLERWMPFILVGLLGFFGLSKKQNINYIAIVYVGVSVVMTIYLFATCDWHFWGEKAFRYYLNKHRNTLYSPHMEFNLYLNTALIFAYYLLNTLTKKWWTRGIVIISMLIIYVNIFFTEGRIGYFSSLLLLGLFLIYPIWKNYRKISSLIIVLFIILGSALVFFHPRMNEYNLVEHNPRIQIWKVGFETINENPMGSGYCNAKVNFYTNGIQCSKFVENYTKFLNHPMSANDLHCIHPHNMFIQLMMIGGILSGILLSVIFIYPFFWNDHPNWLYLSMFQLIFLIQGMFEYIGPHLRPLDYCIGLLILISIRQKKSSIC